MFLQLLTTTDVVAPVMALGELAAPATGHLADWSVLSLLEGFNNFGKLVIASLIGLFGLAALVVGVYQAVFKVIGSDQQKQKFNWVYIIAAFLLAGACIYGGIGLFMDVAQGGQATVTEIGNG